MFAPALPYSEIENYIPGLSHYIYKNARFEARLGTSIVEMGPHIKERYDIEKLDWFLTFITS